MGVATASKILPMNRFGNCRIEIPKSDSTTQELFDSRDHWQLTQLLQPALRLRFFFQSFNLRQMVGPVGSHLFNQVRDREVFLGFRMEG